MRDADGLAAALGALSVDSTAAEAARYLRHALEARAAGAPNAALCSVPTNGATCGDALTVARRLAELLGVDPGRLASFLAAHPCVHIAGGAVLHCVSETGRGRSVDGDVDFWLLGASDADAAAAAWGWQAAMIGGTAAVIAPQAALLTFVRRGGRPAQLVRSAAPDLEALLASFDCPVAAAGFFVRGGVPYVVATPECLETLRSGVVRRWDVTRWAAPRAVKYMQRGYSLAPTLAASLQATLREQQQQGAPPAPSTAAEDADADADANASADSRDALMRRAHAAAPTASLFYFAPARFEVLELWASRNDVLQSKQGSEWAPYHGEALCRSGSGGGAQLAVAWDVAVDTGAPPTRIYAPRHTSPHDIQSRFLLPLAPQSAARTRLRGAQALANARWTHGAQPPPLRNMSAEDYCIAYLQPGARVWRVAHSGEVRPVADWQPFSGIERDAGGAFCGAGERVRAWGVPLVYQTGAGSCARLYAHTVAVYDD